MTRRISIALLACAFFAARAVAAPQPSAHPACDYDRDKFLALDEAHFDQDLAGGGWRALADEPGCQIVAADLLRDYRQGHHNESGLLVWHEAQLRAMGGQPGEAAALMEKSRMAIEADRMGWNPYVDATIAFLRKDRTAFREAKSRLLAVQPPVGPGIPPVVDGYMEVDMADGTKRKMRWPQNIDVVEGLEHCFDKPYGEAYAGACRVGAD